MKRILTLFCLLVAIITWEDGTQTSLVYRSKQDSCNYTKFELVDGGEATVYRKHIRMIVYKAK